MKKSKSRRGDHTMQINQSTIAEQLVLSNNTSKKPCFVVLGGMDVGSVIPLNQSEINFGRDPDCQVVLKDDGISRFHAQVTLMDNNTVIIRDLESTNGTFVGGQKISNFVLNAGDKVLLGRRTVLKLEFQDDFEEKYQKQIYFSSTRDPLTGIYNRKYFDQKIISDISFARRHKIPLTFMIFDLDFFKRVNDTYGHQTGDNVLISVTRTINEMIRQEDTLARYGGEEFVVIAQGTNADGGVTLGNRIRQKVESLVMCSSDSTQKKFNITVSIGIITIESSLKTDAEKVILKADKNLYEAKRQGRNRIAATTI